MLGETLKEEILAGNPILVQTSFITASFFGYAHFRTHLPSREGWMFYDDPMSDLGPSWTARWCHHRPNSEPTELNQTGLEPPPLYPQYITFVYPNISPFFLVPSMFYTFFHIKISILVLSPPLRPWEVKSAHGDVKTDKEAHDRLAAFGCLQHI